jgi:tRNA-dihydrouridine synthase B
MVSARGFAWLAEHEAKCSDRLWGVADEPRPLAVQIWDNDPDTLARVGACLAHEYRVSVVDLNFGCPVAQVTDKAHSGSYLLKEPERVGAIVARVVAACRPTPVTAKIRLGCTRTNMNAIEVARVVEAAGAAALTVHGRTAQDFLRGSADWDRIAEIKPHLRRIPLIGNGDLDSAEKVVAAFQRYPVDGVMIARAALGRPWLFSQVAAALRGQPVPPDPTLEEQRDLLLRHYRLVVERFGAEQGTILMRKYACCYARGRRGARQFRAYAAKAADPNEFHNFVQRYFPTEPE